jgi:hypothetical protein
MSQSLHGFWFVCVFVLFSDSYRRNPCSNAVDFSSLKDLEENCGLDYCNWWQMLLMIEDEFARSKSSGFQLIHPTIQKASHYTSLFRNSRFSDQMLAKWVELGGIAGRAITHLPTSIRLHLNRRGVPYYSSKSSGSEKAVLPRRPASAAPSRPRSSSAEKSDEQVRRPSSAARSRVKANDGEKTKDYINPIYNTSNRHPSKSLKNNEPQQGVVLGYYQEALEEKPSSLSDWGLISRINRNIILKVGKDNTNNIGISYLRPGQPTNILATINIQPSK